MGYNLSKENAEKVLQQWLEKYDIFAPKLMEGEGCFSDTDIVRYGKISKLDDIEWMKKSIHYIRNL